jgi:type 1 fimbriae regulatory protein FimB/type 1 fimbriae regulatory protein FimE
MAKSKKPAPAGPPRKRKYDEVRGVKHVTQDQVDQLRRAAGRLGRHGHRDATMILFGFRHGLRVSELIHFRRDQFNLAEQTVFIRRLKGSRSGTHDLSRLEVTAFRRLFKDNDRAAFVKRHGRQPWAFCNERGGPLTRSAFFKVLARAGRECDPPIEVHPHMLRHGCGYHLINQGITTRRVQDHLGHRNISVTEKYTELAPGGGKPLWDD